MAINRKAQRIHALAESRKRCGIGLIETAYGLAVQTQCIKTVKLFEKLYIGLLQAIITLSFVFFINRDLCMESKFAHKKY